MFLAFVRYSQGPLPEDLLPQLQCPAWVIWGQDDPWEPVDMGRQFIDYPMVQALKELEGGGPLPSRRSTRVSKSPGAGVDQRLILPLITKDPDTKDTKGASR